MASCARPSFSSGPTDRWSRSVAPRLSMTTSPPWSSQRKIRRVRRWCDADGAMSAPADFIPGLILGRMLYEEAGREIVESVVPRDAYAAAFIGKGSDVLGFDTERSTDHDWGPRFQVFLDPAAGDFTVSSLDDALRVR